MRLTLLLMSLFKDMLRSDESLFRNDVALDFSFQPKVLKYREKEQRYVAACIRPLLQGRNGKNVFLFGKPGIGKTIAVQKLLEELEAETDDIYCLYLNCWQKNTTFKIVVDLCETLGYKFTQNKKTEELFKIAANMINKKSAVFVFDEIDKVEDFDFLYVALEQIYRKVIVMITNHKDFILNIEDRIKSRLAPDMLEFLPYDAQETRGILMERKELAFHPTVWEPDAFEKAVAKAVDAGDIRAGLHILKESGLAAEAESSRKVVSKHVEAAIGKLDQISIKNSEELEDETREILNVVKEHSGDKIGELFKAYQESGGKSSYKTFQRKIQKLADNNFVNVKKLTGGSDGSTTIVNYLKTKTLSEY
jgi:archaeal cell division control protein 6